MKVFVVEIRDRQLMAGRFPLAVCASEESARLVAERHSALEHRHGAKWVRPWNRGDIVAVLEGGFSRDYEIWALNLVEDDSSF